MNSSTHHSSTHQLGHWDASAFFENLCATNRLARHEGFTFCRVSGLDGFEEAVNTMQTSKAFVCVSDIADGKFIDISLSQAFNTYGLFVDYGTGRNIPRGHRGALSSERNASVGSLASISPRL